MRIKVDGRKVDVLEPQCRYRACLHLSCLTRDERGCPPAERRKMMTLEQWHGEEHEPRFVFRVRKGGIGEVPCLECGKRCPRSMIIEWQERKGVSSA